LGQFRAFMQAQGHQLAVEVAYESGQQTDFSQVVARMVAARPDGMLFISGALDVARLAQQARRQAPRLPIAASEWAATEQLIELGGEVVEGLMIVQAYNRDDTSEQFRSFAEAYHKRFQRAPGYSSVAAYDAATVTLTALKNRKPGETMKAAALRSGPYRGLQQLITFDANGDTSRQVYFTEIRGGRYVHLN
ncbi:MAG: ABC transporter substrate-binding protein, partial [Curvibacter sp.]